MSEIRYSLTTCGKFIGMHPATVQQRAKKLGIDTSHGMTAANLKAVMEYKSYIRKHYGTMDDLRREMEGFR